MPDEYERLRLLWPDHLGLARGKYLPRDSRTQTGHCLALFTLGFDREMTPHDGGMFWKGLPDLEAGFDWENARPGWEPNTKVIIPEITREGKPVPLAPRNLLKSAIEAWEPHGFTPMVGIETEAFLFEPDGAGGWQPIDTPGAYVYGTGTAVDPHGIIDAIMHMAHEAGLPLETVNSEYDNGQFELTLSYTDALSAADDAFLFKVMAKEVASRMGYLLTFMGKPINGRGGSGLHINLSMSDDNGNNLLADEQADDGLSDLARSLITRGCSSTTSGWPPSSPPQSTPTSVSSPARCAAIGPTGATTIAGSPSGCPPPTSSTTRLEHRVGDGSVTPHQAVATILTAARLGYEKGYDLPDVETLDCIERASTDVVIPPTLSDALDALEADTDLIEALSPAFVDGYMTVKRAEWERYNRWTTDWEMSEYLPFL